MKEKGITLVALVITIIVLLILARSYNKCSQWREWNIKQGTGNIPIPIGFTYIKGDKKGGAVITDSADGQEGSGNEFVWVPVDTPSDMYGTEYTAEGTIVKKWGKLYNFGSYSFEEYMQKVGKYVLKPRIYVNMIELKKAYEKK